MLAYLRVVFIPCKSEPQCSSPYHTNRLYMSIRSVAEMSQSRLSLISVGSQGLMIAPRPDETCRDVEEEGNKGVAVSWTPDDTNREVFHM
jgi:hypothetical protein